MGLFNSMLKEDSNYIDSDYKIVDKNSELIKKLLPSSLNYRYQSYLNWILINNKPYFCKKFNLNDFIGEELCDFFDLASAHYDLAQIRGGIKTISESFIDQNSEYYTLKDLYKYFKKLDGKKYNIYNLESLINVLSLYYDKNCLNLLLSDLFKMASIDYYMRETDRYFNNYMFKITNNNASIAPLYDFGDSFSFKNGQYVNYCYPYCYNNELFSNHLMSEFINKYSLLKEYMIKTLDIDLMGLIEEICAKYNLNFNSEAQKIYKEEASLARDRIKKLVK